jgi:hypothetical protein
MTSSTIIIKTDDLAGVVDTRGWGWTAVPKPGTQNCAAKPPEPVNLPCWGGVYPADPKKGYWVTSIFTGNGEAEPPFPNDRFERDYTIVAPADPNDPRARAIVQVIRAELGEGTEVAVFLALKDKPVVVVGPVLQDCQVSTTEGLVGCKAGQILVQAPDTGAMWAINRSTFGDRYVRA